MKKLKNIQNVQKIDEKKSYRSPQLKEIGLVSRVTQNNSKGSAFDNAAKLTIGDNKS